jgi:protease-4
MKSLIKYIFATSLGVVFGSFLSIGLLVVLVFGIIGLSGSVIDKELKSKKENQDKILKLSLNYEITEYSDNNFVGVLDPILSNALNQGVGLYNINKALTEATNDKRIKGIYINLSSVAVGWTKLKSIRTSLENFKKSKKFIFAYSDSFNEKSYYLSSVADKIYLHKTGNFELNGFSISPLFFKGMLEKLELVPEIFRVGKFKSAIEPFILNKMSKENSIQSQKLITDLWKEFSSAVSKSRNISNETINLVANSMKLETLSEAKSLGFITDFKIESDVISEMYKLAKIDTKENKSPIISLGRYIGKKSIKNILKNNKNNQNEKTKKKIALIFMNGEIIDGLSSQDQNIGSKYIVTALRAAKEDDEISGVVLRINSPGGSALASDVIWSEVQSVSKVKPVYSSFGDYAASGGYYVAAGSEKIFAHPNTITGSIGVFGILFNSKKFFNNKLGITFDNVKTHTLSDIGESNKIMSPAERDIIQKGVVKVYADFLKVVSIGRKLDLKAVDKIAQGRVWSGVAAKEIGLVDEIGNLEDTIDALSKKLKLTKPTVEIFPKAKKFDSIINNILSEFKLKFGFDIPFLSNEASMKIKEVKNISSLKNGTYMLHPYQLNIN